MKKFLTTILILNILMLAGLAGYVMATGRLDKPKALTIMDMLRHSGTPDDFRHQVADILEPAAQAATAAASQSASAPAPVGPVLAAASAQERILYAQQAVEQERLRLEREAQDLQQRQKLLESQRQDLDRKMAQLETDKKTFQQGVEQSTARQKKDSFTKSLALYADLKPKQVKDIFLTLDPSVVTDYLQVMESDQATKIIAEFKTPTEREFIAKILEKIRIDGTSPASTASVGSP